MSLGLAVFIGLVLSVGVERLLAPRRPKWQRPGSAWCIHSGLWLLAFAMALVLVQRPWFAMLLVTAFLILVVVISNAKFKSLAEPFTVQDFRYLRDAIRYPRLYLPFLGLGKALIACVAILLTFAVGFWVEPGLPDGLMSAPMGLLVLLLGGIGLLMFGNRYLPVPSFDPAVDIEGLGLLGSLWGYGRALQEMPWLADSFDNRGNFSSIKQKLPHLVAVQSESFFDPRDLLPNIRGDVLGAFDTTKESSRVEGKLAVPATGANTVRTEFAFLSGLEESQLGAHKFNPYESVLRRWKVDTFPMLLKRLGYKTVCIHPYAASFYSRDRVFPMLGIDEFIDITHFQNAERSGHYVSDAAVTDKILEVLESADQPIFLFAITMENHGPLHLEEVGKSDEDALYRNAPASGFEEMTAYLRHLKHADTMLLRLTQAFDQMHAPVSLCWYGDHVPIMPAVYDHLQHWPRDSDYLIWDNQSFGRHNSVKRESLRIDQLAFNWLGVV